MTQRLTPTCVWRPSVQLLLALQQRFGDPFDRYVNGSQVWFREDIPDDKTVEWRLHPVSGYQRPKGMGTDAVFPTVLYALANNDEPPVPLNSLWCGLEAFPAYGDPVDVDTLRTVTATALSIEPDACGLADHFAIGNQWEKSKGDINIVDLLISQLTTASS